ncbi:MAG TPA: PA2169 family four-helix-bundle protein [Bryobacteraceae bacterium]|jgi:uncharacterized protein (TIGR02284 family)|nr:PA2169 family four-helix-bundle protein [Bryobacteraceae bacterium]
MPGTLQDYAQAVHDVITVCRDAEQGYRGAAHAVNAPATKEIFEQYSAQRAQFAAELQAAVKALGFETIDPQGLGGMLYASWISLKALVTGHDVHGVLVEAERGEDWSLKTYRAALGKTLPAEIASIIERQFKEVQTAHDRIRALRDASAPPEPPPSAPVAAPQATAPPKKAPAAEPVDFNATAEMDPLVEQKR